MDTDELVRELWAICHEDDSYEYSEVVVKVGDEFIGISNISVEDEMIVLKLKFKDTSLA